MTSLKIFLPEAKRTLDDLRVSPRDRYRTPRSIATFKRRHPENTNPGEGYADSRQRYTFLGLQGNTIKSAFSPMGDYRAAVDMMDYTSDDVTSRLFDSQGVLCTDGMTVYRGDTERLFVMGIISPSHEWAKGMLIGIPNGGLWVDPLYEDVKQTLPNWDPNNPDFRGYSRFRVEKLLGVKHAKLEIIGLTQYRHPKSFPTAINSRVDVSMLPAVPHHTNIERLVLVNYSGEDLLRMLAGEGVDLTGEKIEREPIAVGQMLNVGWYDFGEDWYKDAARELERKGIAVFRFDF